MSLKSIHSCRKERGTISASTALSYHGRNLAILYDKTGQRYGQGKGLRLFADGRLIAATDGLRRIETRLTLRQQECPFQKDNIPVRPRRYRLESIGLEPIRRPAG